ncbi:MAG: hypothetical protein HOW97_02400 [Catenulispora sp.]|nr:hypothetical protein [Catenulispora sp.]
MSTSSQNEPAQKQAIVPLSAERLSEIRTQLGDAKPATDALLVEIAQQVKDRREHNHGDTADWDWYCLNASGWLGDRMPFVLRRLLDAEAEVERLTAELAKYVGHEPTLAEEAQYRYEQQVRYAAALEASICQCEPACEGGEYLHAADCPVVPIQMQTFDAAGGAA